MRATRRTQPYRKGPRQPGPALRNMRRGRTSSGMNPMDVKRRTQKRGRLSALYAARSRR